MGVELAESEIGQRIYFVRGHRVMLDSDLADLYRVPTKQLNLAVRRNGKRFPDDFMFQISSEEFEHLRFQTETSKSGSRGGRRYDHQFKVVFDAIRQLMSSGVPAQKKIKGLSD